MTTVGIVLGYFGQCKKERKIMTTVGIGLGSYGQCKKERKIMTTVGIGLGCYGQCKKERKIMHVQLRDLCFSHGWHRRMDRIGCYGVISTVADHKRTLLKLFLIRGAQCQDCGV